MLYVLIVFAIITFYALDWLLNFFRIAKFQGKYVLITGCDSGFGQALALRLDALGFNVFAGCLTHKGSLFLSEKCSNHLYTFLLDVTKPESIENALQVIKTKLPENEGLWGLVNNAGILGPMGCLELCSIDDYQKVFSVNLYGTIEMTRSFLPLLRKSGNGRVVNMSSILGRFAFSGGPYTISKHGVESYSDTLRREVYKQNIRVSIIEPTGFRTNLMQDKMVDEMQTLYENATEEVKIALGQDFLRKYKTTILKAKDSCLPNLDPVLDAIVHAITAIFPRNRYLVGVSELYCTLFAYLPDWITDKILK
ncbi:retinol dehydrogenase 7 [Biomphalaria pfeifferi]|uniref:Retinol dehydrogenase 7 n=1 Tax=Biomphalaria pfeifferi TaxID=112525 RepID=A0AAD8B2I7_BIOPF|nr:retinol dehydrogenase 7 [Biomphalaria pfeifferi]